MILTIVWRRHHAVHLHELVAEGLLEVFEGEQHDGDIVQRFIGH